MRSLELFSGAGGLAKGLELSGFNHVGFVENNQHACDTLRQNFSSSLVFQGDIRDYDFNQFKSIDLIAGGPPCQPFSMGGKHKASLDDRDMFPISIVAIKILKPKAFIFENVKGLLRPSFSDYFQYIIRRLTYPDYDIKIAQDWSNHNKLLKYLDENKSEKPSYNVSFRLINSADYGTPQTRQRVIIVGIRSDLEVNWEFPKSSFSLDRLIWDQYISGEYWDRHGISKIPQYDFTTSHKNRINSIREKYGMLAPDTKPWLTIRDALMNTPDPLECNNILDHKFKSGAKIYPGHTGSLYDMPSKTIKAGVHGVPGGENMIRFSNGEIRYLTVYEAKLIQSFPSSYIFSGAWSEAMRQIGNAVPVNIAKLLGDSIFSTLNFANSDKGFYAA